MAVEDRDYAAMAEVQGDSDTPVTADKLAEAQKVEQPKEGDGGLQESEDDKGEDVTPVTPEQPVRRGPGRPPRS
jgi:hypothetical protein